ncbi:MAG: peptide-methionine (S)-S-oxide reductase MsrA [Nitrosotalea sp.]
MKATFGAGCFWCVEHEFRKIKGVTSTSVGYMGGNLNNPTYEDVCSDQTGHAEVVQVEFDPSVISYAEILNVFWHCHDPTSMNRQGPDVGTQYRSVIFCHDQDQEKTATQSKEQLQNSEKPGKKIVTEILHAPEFYKAEEYHHQYYAKCCIV